MCMMGIANSAARCKNRKIKGLVLRAAELVGIFRRSIVNNDALRAVQCSVQEQQIKEELYSMAAEAGEVSLAQG